MIDLITEGARVAKAEKLHRLSGLLTAVAGVLKDPTDPIARDALRDYGAKVANDLVNHEANKGA